MSDTDLEKEKSKDIGLDPGDGLCGMGGRILEIRKEKSRDAARSRRGKENYEFYELAKLLPLPAAITSQLDKASIIRLSISYLKLRDFSAHGDPPWNRDCPPPNKSLKGAQRRRNSPSVALELFELHQGAHILQSLDGFAFALSNDGRFLYISETVSIYLGLSQVEMAGISMFDYVHHQDHQELAEELGLSLASVTSSLSSPPSPSSDSQSSQRAITPPLSDRVPTMVPNLDKGPERCFCIRMKSTLTKRGVHVRSSGYRVVMIVGRFRKQLSFDLGRKSGASLFGLVGMAIALPPPTITELRIEADTFIMRLTPQLNVSYCENIISSLTDWKTEDISGKDLYCFCHPGDLLLMRKVHMDLIAKGQVLSPSIRLLNKHGGYVWVQICATSLYNSKSNDDHTILSIVHVLSAVEHKDCILSLSQQKSCPKLSVQPLNNEPINPEPSDGMSSDTRPSSTDDFSNSTICDFSMNAEVPGSTNSAELQEKPNEVPDILCEKADDCFLEDITISSDHYKYEGKPSRRKTDRPRKRRRGSDSDEEDASSDSLSRVQGTDMNSENVLENSRTGSDALNLSSCGNGMFNPSLAKESIKLKDVIESPEDLSVKSSCSRDSDTDATQTMYKLSESRTSIEPHVTGSHSVRELEKIMSRHFPMEVRDKCNSTELSDSVKQKSTIQWIGSSSAISTDSMSASAFLRQLYTSRESVIRSNHGRPCVYNGELSSLNMLTPPGTDLFKDQLQLHIPQIAVQNRTIFHSQSPDVLVSSATDAFSMTPPSSVSPREKVISPFQDNAATEHVAMHYGATASEEVVHSRNTVSSDSSRLPFLAVPNSYQHGETADFHQCGHITGPTSTIMNYNSRPSNNNGMWYGSAYTS